MLGESGATRSSSVRKRHPSPWARGRWVGKVIAAANTQGDGDGAEL